MSDAQKTYNVLFICTGNSARSIIAECILNRLGQGRFKAYSAGSHPAGRVNPNALALLRRLNYPIERLRSKSWAEFAAPSPIVLDFVFTVCDNAAGEVCPVWPGQPMSAHWGLPDPGAVQNSAARDRRRVQRDVPHAEQPPIDLRQSADRRARHIEPAKSARRYRPEPGCAGIHIRGLTNHRPQTDNLPTCAPRRSLMLNSTEAPAPSPPRLRPLAGTGVARQPRHVKLVCAWKSKTTRDATMTGEEIAVATHEHLVGATKPRPALGVFERYLTLWVALCIVAGIVLGHWFPAPFQAIGRAEVAQVNLPVAALIWLMIIPMLLKIDFGALHQVREHWRGIGVTLFINWAVKPFSMALLGWLFVGHLFRPWLPADQIDSYIAGLILLAAAPCTAMVFVWTNLTRRRAALHAAPGGAQRHDHGVRLRAASSACCWACRRSRCRGRRCCCRWCCTSSSR